MSQDEGPKATPEELEADIARQRDELAQTVSELQYKLDVPARAKDKASELKERATTEDGKPRPEVIAGAVLAVAAIVGLVVLRIRRDPA